MANSAYQTSWEMHSPVNFLVAAREQLSKCLEDDQQTVDLTMPENRAKAVKDGNFSYSSLLFCITTVKNTQDEFIRVIETRMQHCPPTYVHIHILLLLLNCKLFSQPMKF